MINVGFIMKILYVVGSFPLVSETFILNQINGLIDRGHEVHIYATEKTEGIWHEGVFNYNLMEKVSYRKVFPNGMIKRYLFALWMACLLGKSAPGILLRALARLKDERKFSSLLIFYDYYSLRKSPVYDIIHCHFGYFGNKGIVLRETGALKGKLITTFHGFDMSASLKREGKNFYGYLFEKGDLFLPISDHWRQKLVELGCDESKIKVHRMGIDCDLFEFKPRTLDPHGKVKIVTVGRMVEKKGYEFGIRAVARLKKDYDNVEYTIVGDGPLRNELSSLVNELKIQNWVKIMGPQKQDRVIEILKSSHLFMLPSVTAKNGDQEGIPVVLMEAMAVGLPVVSTYHSGIPEIVEDGVSGCLVPERDETSLYEKLKYLIENHHLRIEMGKRGRKMIERCYDLDNLNDELIKIFQKIM